MHKKTLYSAAMFVANDDNMVESKLSTLGIDRLTSSIEYYLTERCDVSYVTEGNSPKFGVSILKKNNDTEYEEETYDSISNSKDTVTHILSLLCENTVTPISLMDVLEDIRKIYNY